MKLFQWHFGFYLIPLAFLLPVSKAQAAATYTCTIEGFANTTFPNITPANANTAEINTRLTYRCTNTNSETGYVSVCFSVDGGSYGSSQINPRYMARPGPGPNLGPNPTFNRLGFNMKVAQPIGSSNIWGDGTNGSLKLTRVHSVAAGGKTAQNTSTADVFTTVNVKLTADNLSAIPGDYLNNLSMKMTWATTDQADTGNKGCNASTGTLNRAFTVSAPVISDCKVTTTGALNFGNVLSANTPTKITSSANLINVTCTNTTPYNIGLASINNSGNNTGAGIMKITGTGTDTVPYQLQSNISDKVWGNTATSTDVGNGVAGIGNGTVKGHTVFATAPSTDVKPGNYSDIVKVNVNY